MHTIGKKIKSKSGVTIIAALVFFVIAAILGSVVITAASASAGRLTHLHNEQQAYLTVSSAARLVRDEIKGKVCTFEEIFVDDKPEPITEKIEDSVLSAFVLEVAKCNFTGIACTDSFTISSEKEALAAVEALVVDMDGSPTSLYGTLILTLTSADTENPYIMTLTIPFGKLIEEISETEYSEAPDDNNDGEPDGASQKVTTVTKTTIYTFGVGTITRGAPVK